MKAAIIRITDLLVNCDNPNISRQIQDVMDDLDICEWVEFQDQEALNLLVVQTLMNSIPPEALERSTQDSEASGDDNHPRLRYNVGATVSSIFECKNYLYVAYYVSLEDVLGEDATEENYKNSKINKIGSQLCTASVASDLIIVKQDLSYEVKDLNVATSMSLGDLSEYALQSDLVTIFSHRGLIVDPSGNRSEYFYIQNPLENIIMTESDYEEHYRYHEYEVFNHQLTVFVDCRFNADNSNLNESVSEIVGAKVYGRALVALSRRPEFNENPSFAHLTDDRFDSIHYLRRRSPDTTAYVAKSEKVYMNFDKILDLARNRYSSIDVRSIDSLTEVLNEDR
jgi:hypothetical protein